ncbi:MAG: response regulator [Gammaproteobacteria bacterium]|nr:response regulator [Gammaproteobacteria bacterium]MCP4980328.1 response regulator [Gammaproteobacteria bacterium]
MSGNNCSRQIKAWSFLVIEDNAFTSIMVCETLRSLGAQVIETASTGREAFDVIVNSQAPPDVLLVDLRMPEMGGMELIKRLAEQRYVGHLVLTSGVDEQTLGSVEEVARTINVNVLGCLTKPITASALGDLLAKLPNEP